MNNTQQKVLPDFLVIDDDPANNMICRMIIQKMFANAFIRTFTEPESGFSYLRSTYSLPAANKVFLFLDINMPSMTGWEFMDLFQELDDTIKNTITVYILSSSVDQKDKIRAETTENITGYISKPLTSSVLETILPIYRDKI